MAEDYATIPKLAQMSGLSDNTVRRYTRNYPQFFKKKMVDGWEQYPVEESLRLIQRISDVSRAGRRRVEVVADLEKEFEVVTTVEEEETVNGGNGEGARVVEFGPESMAILKRIAKALESVSGVA